MDPRILKVIVKGDSMWPTLNDGDCVRCIEYTGQNVSPNLLVVFSHPLKKLVTCVKRVSRIDGNRLFVEGDNPDPTASDDSHNFGWISNSDLIAIELLQG